jgi:hypothetical protein
MSDVTATLDEARSYAAQSYAQNTRLAYAHDWKLQSLVRYPAAPPHYQLLQRPASAPWSRSRKR